MTAEHPEGWTSDTGINQDDLDAALERVDREAADHNAEYAAGMRNARLIIEQELLMEG